MPTRRERLRVLMRLKSQRQMLIAGIALLAGLAITLGVVAQQESAEPDIVRLGKGVASVEDTAVPKLTRSGLAQETAIASGEASHYGQELAGNRTASGERFDPGQLTAAHRTLPLGSRVRVTNPRNGESVVVRINDRGPYHGNRVIDLSTAAARTIGLIRAGTGQVRLALLVD